MAGTPAGRAVLAIGGNERVRRLVTTSARGKRVVARFVAGDTLEEALALSRCLNAQGFGVALDHLGENTEEASAAAAAVTESMQAVAAIQREQLDAYISIKLTQFGLDLGEHLVFDNLKCLLEQARKPECFVRIDMEGSTYTARTLEMFSLVHEQYANVGIVIQAYLYRSARDVQQLSEQGAHIRLVKGAYSEPPHIAFRRKRDTDRNYVQLMEYLLLHGTAPAIATHDPAILEHACAFAEEHRINCDQFEFQMLLGVRRDLQEDLRQRGYRVRIYVPYGAQWYPYFTRRLAERPANVLFVLRNLQTQMKR